MSSLDFWLFQSQLWYFWPFSILKPAGSPDNPPKASREGCQVGIFWAKKNNQTNLIKSKSPKKGEEEEEEEEDRQRPVRQLEEENTSARARALTNLFTR